MTHKVDIEARLDIHVIQKRRSFNYLGFIIQEDGTDIFVHFKDVNGGIDAIKDNDNVEFEVAEGRKGQQAVNVKKV